MGYKVKVKFGKRTRLYGQGLFGKGKAYKTRRGAEKRAKELSELHRRKATVIYSHTSDY